MAGYTGQVQIDGSDFTAVLTVYGGIIVDAGEPLSQHIRTMMPQFKKHVAANGWRVTPLQVDKAQLQAEILIAATAFEIMAKRSKAGRKAAELFSSPLAPAR